MKTYYKAIRIKTVWYWVRIGLISGKRQRRNILMTIWKFNLHHSGKTHYEGNERLFSKSGKDNRFPYGEEKE